MKCRAAVNCCGRWWELKLGSTLTELYSTSDDKYPAQNGNRVAEPSQQLSWTHSLVGHIGSLALHLLWKVFRFSLSTP